MSLPKPNNDALAKQLLSIKSKLDILAKRRDQAQWEMDRVMSDLLSQFGIDSIEMANDEVVRLNDEISAMTEVLTQSILSIQEQYASLLSLVE